MERPPVRVVDVAGAVAFTAALMVVMPNMAGDLGDRPFDLFAAALIAVAGSALALHRRAPMVVLVATTSALVLYSLREYPGGPVYLTWIVAIFTVSVARGPGRAWIPAVVSTGVIFATPFRDSKAVVVALYVSWATGALLLGGSIRARRAERATLEERARRQVAEERVRIARDLHDSVAHSMASISVQAGVGAHVLDDRPEDARDALLAIKDASRDTLAELRATLGMLRSGEAAPREPTTGLDRLPSLVESSNAAGLPVDVVIEGGARPLPPAVDTVAFRIVQESLTNVIRHAGPARATVAVRHDGTGVEIEVTDNGRGADDRRRDADAPPAGDGPTAGDRPGARDRPGPGEGPAPDGEGDNGHAGAPAGDGKAGANDGDGDGGGGGHGLAGMRERVALLGGELQAGNRPGGGYRVRARLPL